MDEVDDMDEADLRAVHLVHVVHFVHRCLYSGNSSAPVIFSVYA